MPRSIVVILLLTCFCVPPSAANDVGKLRKLVQIVEDVQLIHSIYAISGQMADAVLQPMEVGRTNAAALEQISRLAQEVKAVELPAAPKVPPGVDALADPDAATGRAAMDNLAEYRKARAQYAQALADERATRAQTLQRIEAAQRKSELVEDAVSKVAENNLEAAVLENQLVHEYMNYIEITRALSDLASDYEGLLARYDAKIATVTSENNNLDANVRTLVEPGRSAMDQAAREENGKQAGGASVPEKAMGAENAVGSSGQENVPANQGNSTGVRTQDCSVLRNPSASRALMRDDSSAWLALNNRCK
jgi:uncharacterized protein YeeX (DUF496 family)